MRNTAARCSVSRAAWVGSVAVSVLAHVALGLGMQLAGELQQRPSRSATLAGKSAPSRPPGHDVWLTIEAPANSRRVSRQAPPAETPPATPAGPLEVPEDLPSVDVEETLASATTKSRPASSRQAAPPRRNDPVLPSPSQRGRGGQLRPASTVSADGPRGSSHAGETLGKPDLRRLLAANLQQPDSGVEPIRSVPPASGQESAPVAKVSPQADRPHADELSASASLVDTQGDVLQEKTGRRAWILSATSPAWDREVAGASTSSTGPPVSRQRKRRQASLAPPVPSPAAPAGDSVEHASASPGDSDRRQARAGVVADASPKQSIRPRYPRPSIRAGEEGRVVVEARVRSDGSVLSARVVASSGFDRLDAAALQAVRGATFDPARNGRGEPVAATVRVPVRFVLREAT